MGSGGGSSFVAPGPTIIVVGLPTFDGGVNAADGRVIITYTP